MCLCPPGHRVVFGNGDRARRKVSLMPTGKVKWFDPKKGFGFIIGDEGKDVFVHYTSIVGEGFKVLRDGESVDYELIQGDKGFQARKVKHAESGSQQPSA